MVLVVIGVVVVVVVVVVVAVVVVAAVEMITLNIFTIARNKIMTGLGNHNTSVSYSKTRLHITLQNQKTSHLIIFNTRLNTF